MYYYVVDSPRNEGKDFFEINLQSGEIFTKIVFDREKQGAYALEVEARDGAPSARPNSNQQPNSGKLLDFTADLVLLQVLTQSPPLTYEVSHTNCPETRGKNNKNT